MNAHMISSSQSLRYRGKFIAVLLGAALLGGIPLCVAAPAAAAAAAVKAAPDNKAAPANKPPPARLLAQAAAEIPVPTKQPIRVIPAATEMVPNMEISLGQSHLIRFQEGANLRRVKVDDDRIVQVEVISPREVVLYAKKTGSTVVIIWDRFRKATVVDVNVVGVNVGVDAAALQSKLQQMLPGEQGVKVSTAADSLVLTGMVSDAVKADKVVALAEAYAEKDKKVINMLQVVAPQQVMLEVKMAEVSKNLLDKLGAQFGGARTSGGIAYAITSGFLSLTGANPLSPGGQLSYTNGDTVVKIDAENKDGIVKILAEPNIIAISGQEGSFLAGGKIFIPVPQTDSGGGSVITLEEKEFGVGLKFTPTVLEDGLINLKVAPEVSELSQSGTEIVAGAGRSVLPSFITRRASTTVQLRDGQSFAIAGLIKNNVTETIRRFPILGDIPILGALFRSSEFQNYKTELIFVITPRLVKPLPPDYALPTDSFNPPSGLRFFLNGQMEGSSPEAKVAPAEPTAPAAAPGNVPTHQSAVANPAPPSAAGGFEMK